MKQRRADVSRNTNETQISVVIDLDGSGSQEINSGVPFLDHMLCQIARHALVDLTIIAKGDTHIDDHHSVEDIGIVLGQAFRSALGDKKGITRYGFAYVPLDESLSRLIFLVARVCIFPATSRRKKSVILILNWCASFSKVL